MDLSEPTLEPSVRVLVVEDQRLMRDGIASLLSLQPYIEVIGTAANGHEAIEQAISSQPDVILMDVRMPILDGVAATLAIHRQLPRCRILMLTTFDDEEYVLDAVRAGATGYLLKDLPSSDLARSIQAAHKGIFQVDASVMAKLVAATPRPPVVPQSQEMSVPQSTGSREGTPRGNEELTNREIEVLRLIATGATNREIAESLVIAEGTVKNHISNILSRLGLRDRTQAALFARDAGFLSTRLDDRKEPVPPTGRHD